MEPEEDKDTPLQRRIRKNTPKNSELDTSSADPVKRPRSEPVVPEPPEEETEEVELDAEDTQPDRPGMGKLIAGTEWVDKPTFQDQLSRYPATTRITAPQMDTFDLSKPGELLRLNTLLKGQEPPTAPLTIVHKKQEHFSETSGNWIVLLEYSRLQYVKLTPSN